MEQSSLRELGADLLEGGQTERALGVFAEAVRRQPADHRSRMAAGRCFQSLGEKERAVTVLHACAEGLLRRDYLLSAIAACKLALVINPAERRIREALLRVHARAARATQGRAAVPPPLPPESLYDGKAQGDLMTLSGEELLHQALDVLAAPDPGGAADAGARPPLPLFADLTRDAFVELVSLMGYRSVQADQPLSREGEGGDALYVIVAGKAEVSRRAEGKAEKTLGFLGGGSIFGEMSLLTGAPATATVTAQVDTELFEIRREHLNQLATAHPNVHQALAEFAQLRMARNLMTGSPLFLLLPEHERFELLRRFSFRALKAGEPALTEGQLSPGLFLVLAGELMVRKVDPAGGEVSLGVLREGDIAGEISLLTGLKATATVMATRKSATAFLPRESFSELLTAFPNTKGYLERLSEERLRQIGEALRPAEIIDADELVEPG